jgi:hypothetical protein
VEVFFLVCLFFILFSCRKTETGSPGTLSLNKTAIQIDTAVGTVDSVSVQSTVQWTASVSPGANWLRIDKSSGAPGKTQINLAIVSNDHTGLTEIATITIMGPGNIPSVKLTVTKKPFTFRLDYHRALGGTKEETALRSMAKTLDGGVVITGGTSSNDGDVHGHHGDADLWIVKLNGSGDTVWTKTYGGSAEDGGSCVIANSDGGYLVCGSTSSTNGDVHNNKGGFDAWLLKLDRNGDTIWTKTYGGTSSERANSIILTADGGYAIAGFTGSNDGDIDKNHGSADMWILKINAAGDILWTKTYGGSSWDEASGIVATADGGYALAGLTNSNDQDVSGFHESPFFSFDMWIVRLDAAGNKLWGKALGGTINEMGLSIVASTDGFVITGLTNSKDGDVTGYHGATAFFNDLWVVKLNSNGELLWAKAYGGSFDDEGLSIVATPDGGYAIAGATASKDGDVSGYHDGQGTDDIWILKLDADGARQWAKTIGGRGDDVCGSILPVPGGYILSGFTNSNDGDLSGSGYHGADDIFVMKISIGFF